MKVITPGYQYELPYFGDTGEYAYRLHFIHKGPDEDGEYGLVGAGTTTEEVIEALIDRIYFLQAKVPDPYNMLAIGKLKGALDALNTRTAKRTERGVEGTDQP